MEDLMKPRYRVIGSWPLGHYKKGDIITGGEVISLECDKYQELFEFINWNEDREEHELPKYIKMNRYPEGRIKTEYPIVLKAIKSHEDFPPIGKNYAEVEYEYEGKEWRNISDHTSPISDKDNIVVVEIRRYVPATEKEYIEDINRINRIKNNKI